MRTDINAEVIDSCIPCEICGGEARINVDGALICTGCAVRGFKLECA